MPLRCAGPVVGALSGHKSTTRAGKENVSRAAPAKPMKPARNATAFDPVKVEEFESVSTLVRGRCKIEDVNVVYKTIFEAFRNQKK